MKGHDTAAWSKKGATLSDKSAREEFGLTQQEIVTAINRGELQYRVNSTYGNPFLRLIRSEVEAFIRKKYGGVYLNYKRIQAELTQVQKDLRNLKAKTALLEKRREELLASLDAHAGERLTTVRRDRGCFIPSNRGGRREIGRK